MKASTMNTATQEPPTPHPDSLWVRIDWEAGSQVFNFPAGGARAIAVGSSRTCDVRVSRRGLSPVSFCFERENDRIFVIPIADDDLRIGGIGISQPEPLAPATTIEIGGATFHVSVLTDVAEETEPTSELPTRETVSSHMKRVPADVDPTCIATAAIKIGPADAPPLAWSSRAIVEDFSGLPTDVMPVVKFWDEQAGESASDAPRSAPATDAEIVSTNSGLSMKTTEFGTTALFLNGQTRSDQPQKLAAPPATGAMLIGNPLVSTQDTTSFDLPALAAPCAPSASALARKDIPASTALLPFASGTEPGRNTSASRPRAARTRLRQLAAAAAAPVARLGLLARRRPLRVAVMSLAAAIALVSLLVGVRKVLAHKRAGRSESTTRVSGSTTASLASRPAVTESSAERVEERNLALKSPPLASRTPTISPETSIPRAAPPPSAATLRTPALPFSAPDSSAMQHTTAAQPAAGNSPSAPQAIPIARATPAPERAAKRAMLPADTAALTALKYVVDGRDADALQAYAALAARSPDNAAYRALVRLLQRHGQDGCTKPAALPASCPDIKR